MKNEKIVRSYILLLSILNEIKNKKINLRRKRQLERLEARNEKYTYNRDSIEFKYTDEFVQKTKKSAGKGNTEDQYNLGLYFLDYHIRDYEQAAYWMKLASEKGHAKAKCELGLMYENAWGIRRNRKRAFSLYKQAADKGVARAQYLLGKMYEGGGTVVERNLEMAIYYYTQAIKNGYEDAESYLMRLAPNIGDKIHKNIIIDGKNMYKKLICTNITEYDSNENETHNKNLESDAWYEYDKNINLRHYKNKDGTEVWEQYDDNMNVLYRKHSDGTLLYYVYDHSGRRVYTKSDAGFQIKYEYDKRGNLINTKHNNGFEIIYNYNSKGDKIYEKTIADGEITEEYFEYVFLKTKNITRKITYEILK